MEKSPQASRRYDLEARTFSFAQDVRALVSRVPKTPANREDTRQVTRSSGSVGANYLEANNSLSRKDFRMRIRIALKEAKESGYWLRLLEADAKTAAQRQRLVEESQELVKILGTIYQKCR